jgi:hypothetical protein
MRRRVACALLALGIHSGVDAGEGMWPPSQLPDIAVLLKAAGLKSDPASLSDLTKYPMNAVISLGFCTASFVSPEGLAVTNHHCAHGAIQFNSTGEKNLLKDGFLAQDFADERPGDPALRIYVTEAITDVTEPMQRAVRSGGRDGAKVFAAWEARSKELVKACEQGGQYRCDVYTFHGGKSYALIRQLEIRDVRLVYAPPGAIGKFGGDVDNWMWPRHTGDFAFLRAYVSRDGKSVPYDKNNVPYRPRSWLKTDPQGLEAGSFAMVAGYPGRTNRWRLADELNDAIAWTYPTVIRESAALLKQIDAATQGRPNAAVKYASTVASLNNTMKNFQGQLEGFSKIDGVGQKRAQEQALDAWLAQRGDRATADSIQALRNLLVRQRNNRERDLYFSLIQPLNLTTAGRFHREGSLLSAAMDIYRLSIERDKPDAKRELGYQQRDEVRVKARLQTFDQRYDAAADRALLKYRIAQYAALPAAKRVTELDAWLGLEGDTPDLSGVDAVLDAYYAGTTLTQADERLRWFDAKRKDIEASTDSALVLARKIYPAIERLEREGKEIAGLEVQYRPAYMSAMIAYQQSQGRAVYPDANASLRVSYGRVTAYSPRDAVHYAPFTAMSGVVEKTTDQDPFDTPKAQLDAIKAQRWGSYVSPVLKQVPVNFMADLDITGGNSGSPTLNKRGELIGLAFDGNWESVSSSWIFNPALTRSIHVDIRYMLWVMDEVDHAERLIREMGLTPASE